MPCVFIDTSQFKEILAALPELPPHNWLITDLDCFDYCGWDGCEKWAEALYEKVKDFIGGTDK